MKALLLDVGNTRLKWGVAETQSKKIAKTGSIAQEKIREQGIGALSRRLPRHVDVVMASNVAGTTIATRLTGFVGAHFKCDIHFAKTQKSAYGVTNGYSQPRQMGVDRWVAIIGAWAEFKSACLIVDAGTAVTVDVINRDGEHLGGQILPGMALMAKALAAETSDLPEVAPKKAASFQDLDMFTGATRSAIQSGAENAVIGAIERANKTLRSNAYRPKLVLTGGDASRILQALGSSPLHRPHLVLHGLLHMLKVDQHLSR